jgi:Flp pilus assembly protein TadB
MLAALFAFCAVLCVAAAVRQPRRVAGMQAVARLSTLDAAELAAERETQRPLLERVIAPLIQTVARRVQPRWAGIATDDLRRAGVDVNRIGIAEVMAVKVIGALLGAALAIAISVLAPPAIILLPGLAFAGYLTPSLVIRRRRVRRRAQMLRELPDLVGLLKAFVTAGVPMEQALHLISTQQARQEPPNLLAREVRAALADYGLGVSIEAALDAMAQRVGVEELELLASALAQGKRQGAGMERILRDQEAVVRMQQRNRATADASRVSTRLVGVLVLIYLPEFMVLIMVPLFYGIFLRAFS